MDFHIRTDRSVAQNEGMLHSSHKAYSSWSLNTISTSEKDSSKLWLSFEKSGAQIPFRMLVCQMRSQFDSDPAARPSLPIARAYHFARRPNILRSCENTSHPATDIKVCAALEHFSGPTWQLLTSTFDSEKMRNFSFRPCIMCTSAYPKSFVRVTLGPLRWE